MSLCNNIGNLNVIYIVIHFNLQIIIENLYIIYNIFLFAQIYQRM